MTIRVTALRLCDGGNHVTFTVLIDGVQSVTRTYVKSDFAIEPTDNIEGLFLDRIRSAVKEAGATTNAQISAAVLNKDFKI